MRVDRFVQSAPRSSNSIQKDSFCISSYEAHRCSENCRSRPATDATPSPRVFLACGFTPLHLQTFLTAHIRAKSPDVRPEIRTGLFGDLAGNIERLDRSSIDVLAIALEWADLDPRSAFAVWGDGAWRTWKISWHLRKWPQCAAGVQSRLSAVTSK